VWANDHLVTPRFLADAGERPSFHEAFVTLASVAAATERLRLGTAVIALPPREPTLLARQAASLDALSGGRFVLGVGLGAYPEEVAAIRPRSRGRGAMFDEQLTALRVRLAEASPAPSAGRIPLYMGGHGEAAVERAARWGDGWIPGWQPLPVLRERIAMLRDRAAGVGRDAKSIAIAVEMSATIASSHEQAVRRYEESRLARHRRERDRSGRDPSLVTASNLVGAAESIREKIAALAAAGVDECAALAFPAETQDELVEQWRAFAGAVLARR